MRTVILVPRRAGFPDRDRIWSFVRAIWSRDFPSWPIYEGDHAEEEGPFNRSRAINRAADAAGAWDVAVIIDADTVTSPEQVRSAVEIAAGTGIPVLAYHERIHLNNAATAKILEGWRGNWRTRGLEKKVIFDSCSSCVVVSRPLWDEVGGFDEAFVGWGWEDIGFRVACETVAGADLVKLAGTLWHFYHRVSSGNNRAEATLKANEKRGHRYREARFDPVKIAELLDESSRARTISPPEPVPSTRIPRILHRTVPEVTDPVVEGWWTRFEELHPEWTFRTWRDPIDPAGWETADLWPLCTSGAQRAGLIRLEVLHREGGIYVDSDVEPYRPLESLLELEAFAGWEDRKVVPDAVLGSMPRHPAWAIMLEKARHEILAGAGAWASGPGVTTSTLPGRADVLLLPPGSFYPYHYTEKERAGEDHAAAQPWAFGAHHWHHSWAGK